MLTLVRHAATAWSGTRYCGRTDAPLSSVGREQLAPLVAYLSSVTPGGTTVITSPARRCRETAAAIADRLGGELRVDDRLREIDFGNAEGLTFAQLERRWPPIATALGSGDDHIDWPGGERWGDFAERVQAAWVELGARSTDVVTVTHGGPLRTMLEQALLTWPATLPQRFSPADLVLLVRDQEWAAETFWSARHGAQTCRS
jgi:ribonuclease H / adenosylcobalamin/alpha-ribazole phosphatase